MGDVKIFNYRGREFVLNEATEDGYIEISRGSYEELKIIEQTYQEATDTVYVHTAMYEDAEAGNITSDMSFEDKRKYGQSGQSFEEERLQINPPGNAESVRSSDKGKQSKDLAQAELENSAFSIPENIRRSVPIKTGARVNTVAKNSKTSYNEYATNVMSWAYSASTKTGDVKIFNDCGREFVLNEATEDGYIEISRGNYEEVFGLYEQMQREADNSFYGYAQQIRSQQGRSMRAEQHGDKFRGNSVENSRYTGSQKLQINPPGNAESVRSSDKGKQSKDLAQAELENSAFSIPENIRRSVPIDTSYMSFETLTEKYNQGKISKEDYRH